MGSSAGSGRATSARGKGKKGAKKTSGGRKRVQRGSARKKGTSGARRRGRR